jgi:hypothetical protein
MLPVEQPFKTYTGLDGKPLDNGYVYFGEPDQDPITHPVTVYWDAAGTLPAAQPLRTVNGYIMRAGTPANVFYNGLYSELVRDSKSSQVFYAPQSSVFSIASVVQDFIEDLAAPLGAVLVGSAVIYAATIAGFNATTIPDGAVIAFAGHTVANDGGGGVFTYAEASSQTADNGLVFAPTGGGRLLRHGWTVFGFNGALSPRFFGAKGDGTTNDLTALTAVIAAAFASPAPQVIDLAGGIYLTGQPIEYPAGSDVTMQNGTLKASGSFPTTRHILECANQSGGLVHHDLKFDNLTIDANHRGGCLLIDNYIRVTVKDCKLLHFSTSGLWLKKTIDSHEAVVTGCSAFEYLYNEAGYLTPTPTSVGYQIDSFDNHFVAPVSYYTGTGMVVNAQYNLIAQAHLGGSQWALHITANAAFSTLHQPYIDSGAVLWENPWNSEIIGGKFLHNTADASFSFIVLKPLSASLAVTGLKVVNSTFHNIGAALVDSIKVDTSSGSFGLGSVANCNISNNSFSNVKQKGTKVRKSLYQNAATIWTFNFDDDLAFGAVQWVQDSFYDATNGAPVSRVTSVSGNTVTVTNSVAGNGTVFIEVDANVGTS